MDPIIVDNLGIVSDKAGIGIRLVGRVSHNAVVIGDISSDTEMHIVIYDLCLGPLLQFDNYDVVLTQFVSSDNDEVYTLGGLRNVVFDGNLDIILDFCIIHDIPHKLHGILPGGELPFLAGVQAPFPDAFQYLRGNDVCPDILDELFLVGVVYYHKD